jgi:hypothetical protein
MNTTQQRLDEVLDELERERQRVDKTSDALRLPPLTSEHCCLHDAVGMHEDGGVVLPNLSPVKSLRCVRTS